MNAQTQSAHSPPGSTEPSAQPPRPEFWADTCRELTQMRIRSPRIITLYQQYGCRFWPPNGSQVESILAALDGALLGWEEGHPELFYQALEMNFPELVRKVPGAA